MLELVIQGFFVMTTYHVSEHSNTWYIVSLWIFWNKFSHVESCHNFRECFPFWPTKQLFSPNIPSYIDVELELVVNSNGNMKICGNLHVLNEVSSASVFFEKFRSLAHRSSSLT